MAEYLEPKIMCAGDSAVVIEFGDSIDMKINARVQQLRRYIENSHLYGIVELVPTYRSLAIYFDPLAVGDMGLFFEKLKAWPKVPRRNFQGGLVIVIPVCYGGKFGPDMENVASHTGISEEEIIRRHTAPDYYCYMLGLRPAFPIWEGWTRVSLLKVEGASKGDSRGKRGNSGKAKHISHRQPGRMATDWKDSLETF